MCFLVVIIFNLYTPENEKKVKIAILDSGIFKEHSALNHITFHSYNAISNKTEKVTDDFNHGTSIASLIVKDLNEKQKKSIVIYDVKVLDKNGVGDLDKSINGLKWAIDQKVDIINISAGFQTYDKEFESLIKKAHDLGITIIASAGNNVGFDSDYPAQFKNVISVAATTQEEKQSALSSIGKVDFVSIGENIKAANNKGSYSLTNGSSFATANVSAFVVKKLLENDGLEKKPEEVYNELLQYAEDIGEPGFDNVFGNGLIN